MKREEKIWEDITVAELARRYGPNAIVFGDYAGYIVVEWDE